MTPEDFEWRAEYSVGIEELDSQHRRLLGLCQRISACPIQRTPDGYEILRFILKDMSRYAYEHFRTEEQILRDMHYPDLEQHLSEHRLYESRLAEFLASLKAQEVDPGQLAKFLGHWWVGHILHSDMRYAGHHKQNAPCA